jgi:hypothetical protein
MLAVAPMTGNTVKDQPSKRALRRVGLRVFHHEHVSISALKECHCD